MLERLVARSEGKSLEKREEKYIEGAIKTKKPLLTYGWCIRREQELILARNFIIENKTRIFNVSWLVCQGCPFNTFGKQGRNAVFGFLFGIQRFIENDRRTGICACPNQTSETLLHT